MPVQAGAEAVDKGQRANVQRRPVHQCRTRAVGLQALRNDPQEDAQHHVEHRPVALHEVAQSLWDGEHPLAHRQAREYVIAKVCCRLHHTPGVARGTDTPAFAGIGHKVVVPAVITPGPGKTVGEDAALQILAKRLTNLGLGAVVVALAVELAATGQLKPGLEVLGYGLVEQRALGVARVVELWLCIRWPTRVRMRLRWACGGGHGAVPAWAGCLMIRVYIQLHDDLTEP